MPKSPEDFKDLLQADLFQNWQATSCDDLFRLRDHYPRMGWDSDDLDKAVNLRQCHYAVGWLGGPIALLKDYTQIFEARGVDKPEIVVYSAAGYCMKRFGWNRHPVSAMGWSEEETLAIVQPNGDVEELSLAGKDNRYKLIPNSGETVADVKFGYLGYGLAVKSDTDALYAIPRLGSERPSPRQLADIIEDGEPAKITCFDIVKADRDVTVIAASESGGLYIVNSNDCRQILSYEERRIIEKIQVSPDGQQVAIWCPRKTFGELYIISDNFKSMRYVFKSQESMVPSRLLWCGSNGVVLYYSTEQTGAGAVLRLVPINRDPAHSDDKLPFQVSYSPMLLHSEIDGLRMISINKHQFWEQIESHCVEALAGHLDKDANKLFRARIAYECGDPASDALIREISQFSSDALIIAIQTCMTAATREWDPRLSRYLLKAARYGMDFVDFPRDEFVLICKSLRIMNEVRNDRVGMPITTPQYLILTAAKQDPMGMSRQPGPFEGLHVLINRLITRNIFWLAHEICRFIGSENDEATNNVLIHWAKQAIASVGEEQSEAVARAIISKLSSVNGISFAAIARHALDKRKLALLLIEKEPRASEQVQLYMELKETWRAFECALESGDTNLIYNVLDNLDSRVDIHQVVVRYPEAKRVIMQYARLSGQLENFLRAQDMNHELGMLKIRDAFDNQMLPDRVLIKEAVSDLSRDPHPTNLREDAMMEIQLLELQQKINQKQGVNIVGETVTSSIYKLITEGKDPKDVRKRFQVSDEHFFWIRFIALMNMQRWEDIERMADLKHAPHKDAVVYCMDAVPDKSDEYDPNVRAIQRCASAFARKIGKKSDRLEALMNANALKEAAELAVALRNEQALVDIRKKAVKMSDRPALQFIDQHLA